jgi:Golgi apparatus protein 1
MKVLILTLLLMFPLTQIKAFADDAQPRGVCKDDVAKLCKGMKPGEELNQCMKEHDAEVSQPCKEQVAIFRAKMMARAKQVQETCKGDVEKFCKDKKPGTGEIGKCIREHKKDVSKGCVAAMEKK